MPNRFATADAFKQAVEGRLRSEAERREVAINDLRLRFVMERLLARLFAATNVPWLLKGGYAMDLRYRPRARTTRDIDLTVATTSPGTLSERLVAIREELQSALEFDPGDYLVFRIGAAKGELPGAPQGGGRFPIEVLLAGKMFARFHLDLGFGDPVIGAPEVLVGDDFLAFADIPPSRVRAIPKAQQFAEKIHAYTYEWTDRTNTRVKDLVDLVLLIERGELDLAAVAAALHATFAKRKSHPLPRSLTAPPDEWNRDFPAMAAQVELTTTDLRAAFEILDVYWNSHSFNQMS